MWVTFQRFQDSVSTDVIDSESKTGKTPVRVVSCQYKYIQVINIGSQSTFYSLICREFSIHWGNVCFLIMTLDSWGQSRRSLLARNHQIRRLHVVLSHLSPHFLNLVLLSFSQWFLSLRLTDQNFVCISRLLLFWRIPCPPPASLFEWRISHNRGTLYKFLQPFVCHFILGSDIFRILS
jgi:hypothetical protein